MTYRTMMDYVLDGAPSSNVQALLQTRMAISCTFWMPCGSCTGIRAGLSR